MSTYNYLKKYNSIKVGTVVKQIYMLCVFKYWGIF